MPLEVVIPFGNAGQAINLTLVSPVFAAFPEIPTDAGLPPPADPPYPAYFVHEITEADNIPGFAARCANPNSDSASVWNFSLLSDFPTLTARALPSNWSLSWQQNPGTTTTNDNTINPVSGDFTGAMTINFGGSTLFFNNMSEYSNGVYNIAGPGLLYSPDPAASVVNNPPYALTNDYFLSSYRLK